MQKKVHSLKQMYSHALLRNEKIQFARRSRDKWATDWAAACRVSFSVPLLSPKCGGAMRNLDISWWLLMNQVLCHERWCHSAPSAAPPQAGRWRLCALLPSHTLWQELDERDLYHRNIFPRVRNYYLTCSYDPPAKKKKKKRKHKRNADNQTGENWSSLFLVLRWGVYDTCFIPVNVISWSDSSKLTCMCPHESFKLPAMQFLIPTTGAAESKWGKEVNIMERRLLLIILSRCIN